MTTSSGLKVIGLIMLIGGIVAIPMLLSSPGTYSATVAMWQYQLFYAIYLLVLLGLGVLAPRLDRLVGSTGRRLPLWLVRTFQVTITLQACTVFAQAVISPWLATFAPETLDREDGGSFAIVMGVIWILWSLTLIIVAIVGARRRVVPLPAAVLIAVGGLVIPAFGPVGAIGIGSGLILWGLRAAAPPATAPMAGVSALSGRTH